jgi:cobalt-zinc-cadmium efflux system outer membrane protein
MSMPLFDRRAGARAGAGARRDVATAGLTLREREARNDVHAASERYRSTRRRLELGGDGLAAEAAALLEIAESAYGEGELTLVELLDAARAFREARVAAVELRADTWIAYYDLLRALGRAPEEDR